MRGAPPAILPRLPRTHAILVTHTPARLRRTILGVAWSSVRADTLTLSCDGDEAEIERAAREACAEGAVAMTLVMRAHAGEGRSAQVRNNAVRSLIERGAGDADALVYFDGDCVPDHRALERHAAALAPGRLVLGWRYDLSPAQDAQFDDDRLRRGELPFEPDPAQTAAIERRHRRYRRQIAWKRLGLGKAHKPKLLSANFSCTLGDYRRVNGFDETYTGWGQEDDDFGRRLYRAGIRPTVRLRDILAYHQYHETRAPAAWSEGPNAGRLGEASPAACVRGVRDPLEQAPVRTVEIEG